MRNLLFIVCVCKVLNEVFDFIVDFHLWDMALSMSTVRDTKWLTLEVCRQFQRGNCSRSDEECKFAHPPKSCQIENGRVIACFDSLKVRPDVLLTFN